MSDPGINGRIRLAYAFSALVACHAPSFLLHLQFSFGALRARRVSSAASRLPGITSPRFALHGWQRL
ncbi:MAG: hypothetical protein RPU64_03560 [Candidatus Sedimenticola sp. (ex Thyasira tokunagai)]